MSATRAIPRAESKPTPIVRPEPELIALVEDLYRVEQVFKRRSRALDATREERDALRKLVRRRLRRNLLYRIGRLLVRYTVTDEPASTYDLRQAFEDGVVSKELLADYERPSAERVKWTVRP